MDKNEEILNSIRDIFIGINIGTMSENNINMNLERWGGRGKKELIQIASVGHLKYDRFKQNIKQNNFTEQTLEALSCNSDDNCHPSSTINVCRYLAENCEDEFISAASDSG